jgi:hypothetical protein
MASIGHTTVPDLETLHNRLSNLPVGELSYYLLSCPDKIINWQKGCPNVDTLRSFSAGRRFGETGEVRWKHHGAGYSLLWLSEGELPEGFHSLGNWATSEKQKIYLHGSWDATHDRWQETRIPRTLNYPLSGRNFPQVEVISYRDVLTQAVRFTRFCRFA